MEKFSSSLYTEINCLRFLLGKNCWWKCGKKGGKCSWCGRNGYCCRQGWTGTPDPRCNRAVSACKGYHCCTLIKRQPPLESKGN